MHVRASLIGQVLSQRYGGAGGGGGCTDKKLAGGARLTESSQEPEVSTSKKAWTDANPAHIPLQHTHSTFMYCGSLTSHKMNIQPLAPCSLNISGVVPSEGNIDKAFGEMEQLL